MRGDLAEQSSARSDPQPETVELLDDRDRKVIALRADDDSYPYAYTIRSGSERRPGQAIVWTTAFTAHYSLDTTAPERWKLILKDSMLCVELSQEGSIITDNRTKTTTSSTREEQADSLADDAAFGSPAEVNPTPP